MRSALALVFLAGCSVAAGFPGAGPAAPADPAPADGPAPASTPAPATATATGGACDAAHDHCLPPGTWFADSGDRSGGSGVVGPCVDRDGTWHSIKHVDVSCDAATFHRTEPATVANAAAGTLVISYSASSREPEGYPENETRARQGRWIIAEIGEVDAERGTFRFKNRPMEMQLAGARVIVETQSTAQ